MIPNRYARLDAKLCSTQTTPQDTHITNLVLCAEEKKSTQKESYFWDVINLKSVWCKLCTNYLLIALQADTVFHNIVWIMWII